MKKIGIALTCLLPSLGNGCAATPAPVSVLTYQAGYAPARPQSCPLILAPAQPGQPRTGHFLVSELTNNNGSRRASISCGQGVVLTQQNWCAPHLSPNVLLSTPDRSIFAVYEKYPPGEKMWVVRIAGDRGYSLIEVNFDCTGERILHNN